MSYHANTDGQNLKVAEDRIKELSEAHRALKSAYGKKQAKCAKLKSRVFSLLKAEAEQQQQIERLERVIDWFAEQLVNERRTHSLTVETFEYRKAEWIKQATAEAEKETPK